MSNLKLVDTADGSKTIWNEAIGEHYHSKHGALQESRHVFLKSGLEYCLETTGKKNIKILEVGFGTGLNFLLSADYCSRHSISLNYKGIEAFPLDKNLISQTGYNAFIDKNIWQNFISNYENALCATIEINSYCSLSIAHSELLNFETDQEFDLLYFDAFAAVHQPEVWEKDALHQCCKTLNSGGIFVTYAITGNLKRTMKALGFHIQKVPGAPGKREMLRAIKQ